MKIIKYLLIIPLIAASACTALHKKVPVEQAIIPDWKLGYEHLDILSAAFDQKDGCREYALHSVEDPTLTANMIVRNWQFSWKENKYDMVESDSFIKDQLRAGPINCYKVLNYIIHSEKDDRFIMELEKVKSPDGEVQFLVRKADGGITAIDIFSLGKITHRFYGRLPAQYGCSNNKLRSLAHGEDLSYCKFDSDTIRTVTYSNKTMRENGVLKILSRDKRGITTEIHLNQEGEIIYLNSKGIKFESCKVDTALLER